MTFILILFTFFLLLLLKNKSVALVLVILQVISIVGTFFLGRSLILETVEDLGWFFLMILLLILIILPWKYYYSIKKIVPIPEKKLRIITSILIIVNSIVFIIFLATTIVVQTTVKDINEFKYSEGVSMEFFYNSLPFPTFLFNIAIILYYFSYFILPLHFYYLYQKRFLLAFVCFILSLNIILYGLTFFSRAVVVQFAFLYLATLYMVFGSLSKKIRRIINFLLIIFGIVSLFYFVDISRRRFQEDATNAKQYSKTIPAEAVTQDPLIYGYLDYTSQGFFNGYEVMQLYNGEGFNGKLTTGNFLALFLSPAESYEMLKYRQRIWPEHYSYSFNGFSAYAVYDYGILGSILFGILYFLIVKRMRPRENALQLKDLFLIVLLVQIPLMSIFYNQIGGIFLALLLWIPLILYLKIKVK